MALPKRKRVSLTSPYSEMVKLARRNGSYKVIDGEQLQEARNRINHRANKNISRIEYLERQARIKTANRIIK